MIFRALRLLVIVSALLAVGACSSLGRNTTSYPLEVPWIGSHLPVDAEVLATLELFDAQGSEKFLMALGTGESSLELAILNPQGLPLYTVDFTSGQWQVSRKAATAQQFNPEKILAYLGLIYFDEGTIVALLADGWYYQAGPQQRLFRRDDSAGLDVREVRIHYEGEEPWYRAVHLEDTAGGTQLSISTLEYKHVLPE